MKKILAFALIMVLAISLLTACGDNNDGGTGNGGSKTADNGNGKVNLYDDSIYYVIVDGKKYTMDDTIQDILDRGGNTVSSSDNMNQKIDPNKKFDETFIKKDGKTHFSVKLGNRTNKQIPKTECTVFEIHLHKNWYENVTIYGGITIGSTRAEVKEVFGTNEYGVANTYVDKTRGFEFEYDKNGDDGIVQNIRVIRH